MRTLRSMVLPSIGDIVVPVWFDDSYRPTDSRDRADAVASSVSMWASLARGAHVGELGIDRCALVIASAVLEGEDAGAHKLTLPYCFIVTEHCTLGWVHTDEVRRL